MSVCKRCGKNFIKKTNANKLCLDCQNISADIRSGKVKDPETPQTCRGCGVVFYGRKRQYCSFECQYEKSLGKAKSERLVKKEQAYQTIVNSKQYVKQCAVCNKEFVTTSPVLKTCSKECKAVALKDQRKDRKFRRQCRQRDSYVAPVAYSLIYERDGGICQLCGKPVDLLAEWPSKMHGSLDHIVPLVCGGTHEPSNVQLAHVCCNSSKGAKMPHVLPEGVLI